MHIICGTVLRTSSPIIRNYATSDGDWTGTIFRLSHAALRHIRTAHAITQSQKLHSQLVWLVTVVMYQVAGLTCSFVYGMGLKTEGVIHNLAGDAHHLFFHVRPANQPTITGRGFCHKKFGRPWFIEWSVIRYQPFVSVHNARLHSEWYTTDKGCKKVCVNNSFLPTSIHYLKNLLT